MALAYLTILGLLGCFQLGLGSDPRYKRQTEIERLNFEAELFFRCGFCVDQSQAKFCCRKNVDNKYCCKEPEQCPAVTCQRYENEFEAEKCPSGRGCYRIFTLPKICCLPVISTSTSTTTTTIWPEEQKRKIEFEDTAEVDASVTTGNSSLGTPYVPIGDVNATSYPIITDPITSTISRRPSQHDDSETNAEFSSGFTSSNPIITDPVSSTFSSPSQNVSDTNLSSGTDFISTSADLFTTEATTVSNSSFTNENSGLSPLAGTENFTALKVESTPITSESSVPHISEATTSGFNETASTLIIEESTTLQGGNFVPESSTQVNPVNTEDFTPVHPTQVSHNPFTILDETVNISSNESRNSTEAFVEGSTQITTEKEPKITNPEILEPVTEPLVFNVETETAITNDVTQFFNQASSTEGPQTTQPVTEPLVFNVETETASSNDVTKFFNQASSTEGPQTTQPVTELIFNVETETATSNDATTGSKVFNQLAPTRKLGSPETTQEQEVFNPIFVSLNERDLELLFNN